MAQSELNNKGVAKSSSCKGVPSLHAVLSEEAELQSMIEDAYTRQAQAVEDAKASIPEIRGDSTVEARKLASELRARIEEETAIEIKEIKKASKRSRKDINSKIASKDSKAYHYVIGLITGLIAPETSQEEVVAC